MRTMNKPTMEEKNQTIEHILSKGLQEPEGIGNFLMRMYRAIGLKYIFFDLKQVIVMTTLIVIGIVLLLAISVENYNYSIIFLLSPLFFVMTVSATEWMERSHPIYELKKTFKYTMKDMIIFRTLCYSLISVVLSVFLSLGMANVLEMVRATSIAFSALFLCTLLTVAITRRFNHPLIYLTSFGVWSVMNLVPLLLFNGRWNTFLAQIPLSLTLIVSLSLIYLYVKELKQFIHMKDREVEYDAAS